ncbi:MAG: glutathione S-transferase N-terminal domain-containing protein [Solirubrobacterales bacterium]|nr:glutathione S-transferase N-terminal domain-containing protein [Solirubrobacterales bacterium]
MAKVKLHRCSYTFLHMDADACWRLQKALDERGVDYEIVKHGYGKGEKSRADVVKLTGQKYVPVLELADGTVYREETDDMIAKLKANELPGPLTG